MTFVEGGFSEGRDTVAFAIIEAGGKQFRVAEGDVIDVPSMPNDVGVSVEFDVLVHGEDGRISIGEPRLEHGRVTGTVLEHRRLPKMIVFKKKRRKQYKRTRGHRQGLTRVRIDSIAGT